MRMSVGGRKGSMPVAAYVVLGFALTGLGPACTLGPKVPPNAPPGPALPFTAGTYDCSLPGTWKTTTFPGLVPSVQRALATDKAQDALTGLLSRHYDQEVTCVAAYIHDESVNQQATATEPELAAKRVTTTAAWISQEAARGLVVANYGGEAH